jgi:hypothetical protein
MKRFVFAPALAALVLFVFGALYWMNPLPYHALNRLPDDAAVIGALDKLFPASGGYLLPGMYLDSKQQAELSAQGPIAEVHIVKHGLKMVEPTQLILGYVHEFVVCVILVMLLQVTGASSGTPGRVVKSCAWLGVLLAAYDFLYAIWWYHSWAWQSFVALYDLIAFTLAGLVLAKFVAAKSMEVPHAADTTVAV